MPETPAHETRPETLLQQTRTFIRTRIGWSEMVTLSALLIVAGGIWGFAEIVDEVLEGDTHEFDKSIMLALRAPGDNADPIGPASLELAMRDFTALGGYPVIALIALLAVGYLAILRRWPSVGLVIISLAGGAILNTLLKGAFARPRPDLVAHLVDVHTSSLPSGHAMISAVAYLTIGALVARAQPNRLLKAYTIVVSVGLTLLVGTSRVYLGVHWPTDVLAGWCMGAAWAIGCLLIAQLIGWYWGRNGADASVAPAEPVSRGPG